MEFLIQSGIKRIWLVHFTYTYMKRPTEENPLFIYDGQWIKKDVGDGWYRVNWLPKEMVEQIRNIL